MHGVLQWNTFHMSHTVGSAVQKFAAVEYTPLLYWRLSIDFI